MSMLRVLLLRLRQNVAVAVTVSFLRSYAACWQCAPQDAANADPPVDVAAAWGVTPATLIHVTRLLKPSEDEVTQHYAVKTIENISSQVRRATLKDLSP